MTNLNIYAGLIIIIFCAIILGIKVYKNRNRSEKMTIDTFIDTYGDQIIKILQDVIMVLKVSMDDYNSQEEYETAIISTSINVMKENSVEFGIPAEIVDLLDTDSLTKIIQKVMSENKPDAFSVLDSETITENKRILDENVVEVLGAATEVEPK